MRFMQGNAIAVKAYEPGMGMRFVKPSLMFSAVGWRPYAVGQMISGLRS